MDEIDPNAALTQWSKDVANFANLEVKDHERHFDDISEDLLIRLDEFEHLLEMSKGDTTACLYKQVPRLAEKFKEMEKVFEKIDRLEVMVVRIKADMDKMEKLMTEAERTVTDGIGGGALSSLMPLFFGSRPLPFQHPANPSPPQHSPSPVLFSTSDFFPKK